MVDSTNNSASADLWSTIRSIDSIADVVTFNFERLDELVVHAMESDNPFRLFDRLNSWEMDISYRLIRIGIFNYTNSAVALMNQARKRKADKLNSGIYSMFRNRGAEEGLFQYLTTHFDENLDHMLVLEIRNACVHDKLPPHQITFNAVSSKTTISIQKAILQTSDRIPKVVRTHLESVDTDIELMSIFRRHHKKILVLQSWLHMRLKELYSKEFAAAELHRKKRYDNMLIAFARELESLLSSDDDRFLSKLQFLLAGVLSSSEQLSLQPHQKALVLWNRKALSIIRNRLPVSAQLLNDIEKRVSSIKAI